MYLANSLETELTPNKKATPKYNKKGTIKTKQRRKEKTIFL